MELSLPHCVGDCDPSIELACSLYLSLLGSFVAVRSVAIGKSSRGRRPPSARRCNRYSAKMPTVRGFTRGDSLVKLCCLGNLGVDFRTDPNFNRLE